MSSGSMRPRKYYHHVERDPENIKSIWKVLHMSTFLLIILNSLVSAYAFGDILKIFNYRCVLHVEPSFRLTEITYYHNFTQDEIINLKETNSIIEGQNNTTEEINTEQAENTTTQQAVPSKEKIITSLDSTLNNVMNNTQKTITDWSKIVTVTQSLKNIYIINNTIWYKNDSEYGKIDVYIRGSDYGSSTSCDLVLFVPLVSLISAAAFGALIMLFGKSQQGQRSWIIVYPVLIASAILTILSIIAMISMKNGVEDFCSQFQDYTGQSKCTHFMSYFTFQGKWTTKEFWDNYIICYYSYILALLLWAVQLVVTILRLGSLADFHTFSVSVEKQEINDNEEFDEKIHNVLIKSGMKPFKKSVTDESMSTTEKNEDSTAV